MAKFTFDKPLVLKGREYAAGDTADLDADTADKLEAAGYGAKAKAGRPKKTEPEDG